MKTCPKCNAEVDNNYDLCWNCQYSFTTDRVLDKDEFMQICPKCGTVVDSDAVYCRSCQFDLREINSENGIESRGPKNVECLKCKVQLEFRGTFRFHEGTRYGALGNLFELFTNRESFDLYNCPECGKIEFYLPGYD